ncbi:MAG: hypothetical protein KDC54_09600 [Lewinella sp.]|nr:hypothetical protein [Lewinella sp.]
MPFLDLNGQDEYAELADFSLGSSFTVELWVNPRSTEGKQVFVAKHDAVGDKSLFNLGYRPEGVHVELNGAVELAYGEKLTGWQHLAVVVEKTRSTQPGPNANREISRVTVVRNGRLLWAAEYLTVVTNWQGRPWLLGQEWDRQTPSDFFDGQIAEVRFWDHARSLDDIGADLANPQLVQAPGLVAYYRAQPAGDPSVLINLVDPAQNGRLISRAEDLAGKWGQYRLPAATVAPTIPLIEISDGVRTELWWQMPWELSTLAFLLNETEGGAGSVLARLSVGASGTVPQPLELSLSSPAPPVGIQGRWKPQQPGLALQLPGSGRIGLDALLQQAHWPLDLSRAMTLEAWVRPGANTGSTLKVLHLDRNGDERLALGFLPDGNGSASISCAGLLTGESVSRMHPINEEENKLRGAIPCIAFDPAATGQAAFAGDSGTIECWFKTRTTDTMADGSVGPTDRQCLLSFAGDQSKDSISINLDHNRLLVCREDENHEVASPVFGIDGRPDLMDGEWHHIAIIFSQKAGKPFTTFQVDDLQYEVTDSEGDSIFSFTSSNGKLKHSGGLKSMGGHLYTLGYEYVSDGYMKTKPSEWIDPFKGYLGEVRIWNKARTQTELINNRLELSGSTSGLVGHYLPKEVKTIVVQSQELTVEGFPDPNLATTVYRLYNEVAKSNEALSGILGENNRLQQSDSVALAVGNQAHASMALGLSLTQDRWMHLAAAYHDSHSLAFTAAAMNFVDAGNNMILTTPKELTLETWVRPEKGGKLTGTLISKMSPASDERGYQLSIDNNGFVHFEIHTSEAVTINGQATKKITQRSQVKLPDGQWNHLAVTCQASTETNTREGAGGTTLETKTHIRVQLIVNGVGQADFVSQYFTGDISFQTNEAPLWLGRSSDAWRPGYLNGEVGAVRIWGRPLSGKEIARSVRLRKVADNQDKLLAHWAMESGLGLTLYDKLGINHGRISHVGMWRISDLHAGWKLFLDGQQLPMLSIAPAELFAGSQPQFSLGGSKGGGTDAFAGILDELRFWSGERTEEEISDTMYRQLTGHEASLAAYFRFDERGRIADRTGRFSPLAGQNGNWWVATDSPTGTEGPAVKNVIHDTPKATQVVVKGVPSALEYGDMQYSASGQLSGVLKRHYLYQADDGRVVLRTGFKVGDLDLSYIGQVQTAPTLVGYIEGAPPVPSENLTVNDVFTDDYVGASKIELIEAEDTLSAYSSSSDQGSHTQTEYTVGALVNTEVSVMGYLTVDLDMKSGYKNQVEVSSGTLHNSAIKSGSTRTITRALELVGSWEDTAQALNPVGRRYVPANVGYALVKSRTSDLYALKLRHSDVIIAYETLINPDIPEDWNIIMFQMNPGYTKNGTLDGKVGLENDEHYPAADAERGSYFKPREAYALKEEIEREREELLALYEQFDAVHKGKSNDQRELLSERWKNKIAKRSMVNTYVWTADGGLYAEEESTLSVRTESIGGTYARKTTEGFQMEGSAAFGGIGTYGSYDSLSGQYQNFTVMKEKEDARSFSLKVDLTGEGFLKKWSNEADPGREDPNGAYLAEDMPGKVSAYRFMTFYLSPQKSHFDTFFNEVVDQNWLWNSGDQNDNAVALRGAKAANNGVWRVLHRVTYVNRVRPEISPMASGDHAVRKIIPAINQAQNQRLLDLIGKRLAEAPEINAAAIAEAISVTLNGDLGPELAWWPAYWAAVSNTPVGQGLRNDLHAYLRFFYGLG